MGLRFRRSVRLIPGVRLNFSRSGVSASFGVRGARVTVGKSGTHLNLGIPGTGLSYRTRLDGSRSRAPSNDQPEDFVPRASVSPPVPSPEYGEEPLVDGLNYTGRREYRSAHPDTLSSSHLAPLAGFLSEVEARRAKIGAALSECRGRINTAQKRLASARSLLWRPFIAKNRVAEIEQRAGELSGLAEELENTLEGTVIDADFGLSDEGRSDYMHLVDAYKVLSRSQMIWDIATSMDVNRAATRSAASNAITRTRVGFETSRIPEMDSDCDALLLRNANGGDVYFLPGFLAIRNPRGGFALIDVRDVDIRIEPTSFIEQDALPSDSEQVGHVWAKSNKDGSPDRRFRDNYQIPLVRYGELALRSKTGLNEVYQVSNWNSLRSFQVALKRYMASLPRAKTGGGEVASDIPYDAVPDLEIPFIPTVPSKHTASSIFKTTAAICILLCGLAVAWSFVMPRVQAPLTSTAGETAIEPEPAVSDQNPTTSFSNDSKSQGGDKAGQSAPTLADNALSREQGLDLQKRLTELGYKPGPIDGNPGPRTLQAFNSWRLANDRTAVQKIDTAAYLDFLQTTK